MPVCLNEIIPGNSTLSLPVTSLSSSRLLFGQSLPSYTSLWAPLPEALRTFLPATECSNATRTTELVLLTPWLLPEMSASLKLFDTTGKSSSYSTLVTQWHGPLAYEHQPTKRALR